MDCESKLLVPAEFVSEKLFVLCFRVITILVSALLDGLFLSFLPLFQALLHSMDPVFQSIFDLGGSLHGRQLQQEFQSQARPQSCLSICLPYACH